MADIQLISASTITAIGANSVKELADNPKLTPTALKDYFVKPITSSTNSIISEVNRIVEEANTNINANATAITTETTNRETAVTNEANTRANADTTNANAITQEATTRETNDNTLQSNIDTLSTSLTTETSNRTSADNTLQTNIDNEALARQNADALKVDKVDGKELIPTTELTRLGTLSNYDDTSIKGRVSAVETTILDLSSPFDNLGKSGEVTWDNQVYNATVQQMIDDYVKNTLCMDVIDFAVGDVVLINNKSSTPLTLPINQSLVDTGGVWLWEYDGTHWFPAVPYPNTFTNDLTNELKAQYDSAYQFSQNHTNPTKTSDLTNDSGFTNLTIGTLATQAGRGDLTQTAYAHSQAAHAPSNAQKNSDITKAEIEAKLTGEISTHSHALPSHNHDTDYYKKSETYTKTEVDGLIPTNTVSSTTITTMVKLSQAEYDALGTKDTNTFYVIVG